MGQDAEKQKYYSKYEGTVINNIDPMRKGRCQVMVPDVSPAPLLSWAKACLPIGGPQAGMYATPNIGACVWVEFAGGDIDKPIVVGGRYENVAEIPALAQSTPPGLGHVQLNTQGQHMLAMSDMPGPTGGFTFMTPAGVGIKIDTTGITLLAPPCMIKLTAAGIVMNSGALVVLP